MIIIIFVCLIFCFLGYILNKQIHHIEFIGMCISSVLVSCIVFSLSCIPVVNDTYFQSGKYTTVSYHPYFVEEYQQRHEESYACGHDDEGNTQYCTRVYYTTEHDTHPEYYYVEDSLQQGSIIDKSQYNQIRKEFGNVLKIDRTCRFNHSEQKRVKGDSNLYYYNNETNSYKYPTTKIVKWHNPLKKTDSLFNTKTQQILRNYPIRSSWVSNNRMQIKQKSNFTKKDWDILNTKIYEITKSNVALLEVDSIEEANQIKYDWNTGKKNDIIICFSGNINDPSFVKVFGWYESEMLSVQLETDLLEKGIDLYTIETDIIKLYKPFDFKQFQYLALKQPSFLQLFLTFVVTIIIMAIFYACFSTNDLYRF